MLCKHCGTDTESISALISHCKRKHGEDISPFVCPYDDCIRKYSQVKSFRSHTKDHINLALSTEFKSKPIAHDNDMLQLPDVMEITPVEKHPLDTVKIKFEEDNFKTEVGYSHT